MNHHFTPHQLDSTKCAICSFPFLPHTPSAECEACSKTGPVEIYKVADIRMLLCPECTEKEKTHQNPEKQAERVNNFRESLPPTQAPLQINSLLDKARQIDYSLEVKQDIFNAQTVSNEEVRKSIQDDATIPPNEKQFAYAKFIQERIETFQKVIFDAQQVVVEHNNRIRVMQEEWNKVVIQLREEERAKLRAISPSYKPPKVEKVKSTTTKKTPSVKFDKKGLIEQVNILQGEGLPVQMVMIQQVCVSRNMTPVQAANVWRELLGGKKG